MNIKLHNVTILTLIVMYAMLPQRKGGLIGGHYIRNSPPKHQKKEPVPSWKRRIYPEHFRRKVKFEPRIIPCPAALAAGHNYFSYKKPLAKLVAFCIMADNTTSF